MQKRYWLRGGIVLGSIYILCFLYILKEYLPDALGGAGSISQIPGIIPEFLIPVYLNAIHAISLIGILPAIAVFVFFFGLGGNILFFFLGGLINLIFYFLIGAKLGGFYKEIKNRNTESPIVEPSKLGVMRKLRRYALLIVIILIFWKIFF